MYIGFSRDVKQFAEYMLKRTGIDAVHLADKRKKLGRGIILVACLAIVPHLFWNFPLAIIIVSQVLWAGLLYLGATLAFDEKKPER